MTKALVHPQWPQDYDVTSAIENDFLYFLLEDLKTNIIL